MKYKYYVSSVTQRKLTKQKLGPKFLEKIKEYQASNQQMVNATNLHGTVFVTKVEGYSGRPTFVWMIRQKEDATVYVLRAAYNHAEYEKSINDQSIIPWIEKNELLEEEETEVNNILDELLFGGVIEIQEKLPLSGAERNFISCQLDINQQLFEETIYETENWVNYIKSKDTDFTDFYNSAYQIENHIYDNLNSPDGWQSIQFKDKIIHVYHNGKDWILSDISDYNPSEVYEDFSARPIPTDFRRGYPYSFFDDKDEWREMELEKKSNMVLSRDQVDIVSNSIEYPLFITGRAGSGKSTALQYLFAEVILRYIQNDKDEESTLLPPVYLSYSENLIQDAVYLSRVLLEKNSFYKDAIKGLGIDYDHDVKPQFEDMFFVFQKLVKQCIQRHDPTGLAARFITGKYISFAKFNRMWNQRFGNIPEASKNYSPSVSWHVIRTYIKGWNSENLLTPKEYALLPESRKSVSEKTFRLVYDKVWTQWYSQMKDLWDDQDLVRYSLEHQYVDEQFSAIFCDEAQDFTRIELDFIMKLSSFTNRKIDNIAMIKQLPFVFAGDEFQTLNPTGFSWESLRGYFTDRLCELTGLSEYKNSIGLSDPIELSENFRSTRQVVKLANRIQLLRNARFDDVSKPQLPHFSKDGNPIVCLSPKDKKVFEQLKSKGVILIIPAADGESAEDYIKKSALRDMIEFVDGTPQGITILNPTQAKGLEYPNVAVYGFNCLEQYTPLSIVGLRKWFANPVVEHEKDIDLKYQISNAYVAVTRAGTNLYIIDDFDRTSFWCFAFTHPNLEINSEIMQLNQKIMEKLSPEKRKLWTDDLLGWIIEGKADNITDDNIAFMSSGEYRDALEKRAESLLDVELMRQAACRHKEAGRKLDENRCWAKAFAFEEQFLDAAEYYTKAEMYDASVDYYWLTINEIVSQNSNSSDECSKIIRLISRLGDNSNSLKVEICMYCVQKPDLRTVKLALDKICSYLEDNENEWEARYAWNYAVNMLFNKVKTSNITTNDISIILDKRNNLKKFQIDIDASMLAKFCFSSAMYKECISLWEELDKSMRPVEYYRAKVNITPYPVKLEMIDAYSQLSNRNAEIISEYHKNENVTLKDHQRLIVANAARIQHEDRVFTIFLPLLLANTTTLEMGQKIIEEAMSSYGLTSINLDVLDHCLLSKLSDQKPEQPKVKYVSPQVREIIDALSFFRKVRRSDYINRALGPNTASLSQMKNFTQGLRQFASKPFANIIFAEIGRQLETRNSLLDNIHYYTNVVNMVDDSRLKQEMVIRLIANKERYVELKDDDKVRAEVADLRQEWHIDETAVFPTTPIISLGDWERLFAYAISISNEILQVNSAKTLTISNESKHTTPIEMEIAFPEEPTTAPQIVTKEISKEHQFTKEDLGSIMTDLLGDEVDAKTKCLGIFNTKASESSPRQEFDIAGYSIVWIPQKNEISIKFSHDNDDYSIKIKKGKMPSDADFELRGDRLFITEKDEPTPFSIALSSTQCTIAIHEGDEPTGMVLAFNAPNS